MKVNGKDYRTVWMEGNVVYMIDQNRLPFSFHIKTCRDYRETAEAIRDMTVRGAGAIGAAAGFAMAQAMCDTKNNSDQDFIRKAKEFIESTRPTARNLFYAVDKVFAAGKEKTCAVAQAIADEDASSSHRIGELGEQLIKDGYGIATHCNAGWLAFVDHGTALSPIYGAQARGKKIFVYVDETRPRGQGARLTAWELKNEGVPHAIIPDNAFAHYASLGKIQMVIVGADRIALNGDTANKIGTLEKAIVAREFGIPFYVAAPWSTFDPGTRSGGDIVIEERGEDEVLFQEGPDSNGDMRKVRVSSPGSQALNPSFDVTPAKYISGFITEKGIFRPEEMKDKVPG